MFFPANYFPAAYFPAGLLGSVGGGSGKPTQGFQYLLPATALPHTYQGPWTLSVAQGLALYPGDGDDTSGLRITVTPEGIPTTAPTVRATGLPNPLPAPFDESLAVLTLTGSVDGHVRSFVLFPDLEDGGAAAEAAASAAILATDTDLSAGPALVTLLPPSSILTQGSDGVIHVLLTGRDADGANLDFSDLIATGKITAAMAVTRAAPLDTDFAAADLLVRTAAPAGTYARLAVGKSTGRVLIPGAYGVAVKLTLLRSTTNGQTTSGQTLTRQAPGTLIVTK